MQEPDSKDRLRATLAAGDYMDMWRVMAGAFPGSPLPKTPEQAEIIMHRIRVETDTLSDKIRCYSHSWLLDHNIPSGLPDRLLPKAMRLYPRIVDTVGIAVKMPRIFKEVRDEVELAMSNKVEELHADGVDLKNRSIVHPEIFGAREKVMNVLIGRGHKRIPKV